MSDPTAITGYVAGFKFQNNPANYNSGTGRFLDLSGYGSRQDIVVTAGTPTFATTGGKEGWVLDNTCHAIAHNPIPWQGTLVAVLAPNYVSGGTVNTYPLIFGDAVTVSSNGRVQATHAGGERRVQLATAGAALNVVTTQSDNEVRVVALASDQETRKGYATLDGVTITEATAAASSINGNAVALGAALNGIRIGNINGTAGDTTQVTTLTTTLYELYFFAPNVFRSDPSGLATFMAALRSEYSIT